MTADLRRSRCGQRLDQPRFQAVLRGDAAVPGRRIGPTLLGRNKGSAFQLASHIGLEGRITSGLEPGYRFQHMSNGSLRGVNSGMNEHMVVLRAGGQASRR